MYYFEICSFCARNWKLHDNYMII